MELTKNELYEINAGGFTLSWAAYVVIAGAAVMVMGMFDGYINPKSCN